MTRLTASEVAAKSARNRAARIQVYAPAGTKSAAVAEAVELAGKFAGPSKHHSVKVWVNGERFDSKLEARVYQDLKLLEKAGEIRNLRRQVKFSLFMPGGEHYGVYKADFVFDEHLWFTGVDDGWRRIVADAKSPHTRKLQAWQKVRKLMSACHGITVKELP